MVVDQINFLYESSHGLWMILKGNSRCMQLFRQRLSHKSMKVSATMLIGVIGSNSLALHV